MSKEKLEYTTLELAKRWGFHPQTLINWRYKKRGPSYVKKGKSPTSQVVYKLKDVKKFEKSYFDNEIMVRTSGA